MWSGPYCLMATGLPVSDAICDILFYGALGMASEKINRRSFHHKDGEGEIRTQFKPAALGEIAGMEFEAQVETEQGTAKMRFIVRTRDLEDLDRQVWSPWIHADGPSRHESNSCN
ncbi:MAG TPA: hypothetical protein VFQ60_00670 [Patescibacteria group bacterium]|nr:hypothetical protein [Patescibacteria group bacterium]